MKNKKQPHQFFTSLYLEKMIFGSLAHDMVDDNALSFGRKNRGKYFLCFACFSFFCSVIFLWWSLNFQKAWWSCCMWRICIAKNTAYTCIIRERIISYGSKSFLCWNGKNSKRSSDLPQFYKKFALTFCPITERIFFFFNTDFLRRRAYCKVCQITKKSPIFRGFSLIGPTCTLLMYQKRSYLNQRFVANNFFNCRLHLLFQFLEQYGILAISLSEEQGTQF